MSTPLCPWRKSSHAFLLIVLLTSLSFTACKKEEVKQTQTPPPTQVAPDPNDVYRIAFSKTLAKAVQAEPVLRSFIKTEAAKLFDNDYDVLYQAVKDKKLSSGITLHETLLKYADDADAFNSNVDNLPLLTIYVPELPNFNAESWDVQTQVPLVAVAQRHREDVSIFDAEGKELSLSSKYIPGFPVLVVKSNERVVLSNGSDAEGRQQKPYFSNARFAFSFLDDAFNGSISKASAGRKNEGVGHSGERTTTSIDSVIDNAYTSGVEWHRDYIYYGISPTNSIGRFTNRFSESITSFKFTKPEHLGLISDHDNDSKAIINNTRPPAWTEGRFEIRISVFINAKNAVGQELRKYFTATGPELFKLEYDSIWTGVIRIYLYKQATPISYNPNIELVPWDLEQYGSVWKFAVSEYDPSEEITRTVTNTTTYGANFEINASTGDKNKIGGKFGASMTTTHTEVFQYKTTYGSEDLAEGVLDFRTPVIINKGVRHVLGFNIPYFTTYEVTTGIVSFSVEPKRIY